LRVAPDGAHGEMEPTLEVVRGRGRDGPCLDHDRRGGALLGKQAARHDRAPADGDADRRIAIRAGQAVRREERGDAIRDSRFRAGVKLDVEPMGRAPQAFEMLAQLRGSSAAGTQGLEHAVAELEAAIERGEMASVGGLQRAVDPDVPAREVPHTTSRAPIPDSGPRALATVSSHSAAGSLRHVIPPPTCSVRRSPSATNVRIRMLVLIAPSGPIQPAMPVYGPRRTGSSASMSCIARIFGAPVIEPPGNDAARRA